MSFQMNASQQNFSPYGYESLIILNIQMYLI